MLFLAALLVAMPADKRLAISAKVPRIERIEPGALFVEIEGSAHAELLASDEVLIEARQPGTSLVFLFYKRLVRVIEVAVEPSLPPLPTGHCAPVVDLKSYQACRGRIAPGDKVVFENEGLQAELKAAQAELDRAQLGHVLLVLSPYGLRLKGTRDDVERRHALRAVWPALLGPLRLDQ